MDDTTSDRWDARKARDHLADAVGELILIWPALAEALERDQAPGGTDKVTSSGNVLSVPVNVDVLRALASLRDEVPAADHRICGVLGEPYRRRDVPDALRQMPRFFDRLLSTNALNDARQADREVQRWRRLAKAAVGLRVYDRALGQFCPRHDDPLVELVAPGDEGWLRYRRTDGNGRPVDATVDWSHVDAVVCRHCDATWTPGQYFLLGRLLRDADRRRVEARRAEQAEQVPA